MGGGLDTRAAYLAHLTIWMEANHTTVNVILNLKFHWQYLIIFLSNVGGKHQNNPGDTGVNWSKRDSTETIRVERSGLNLSFHSFKSYF